MIEITISQSDAGQRLDKLLARRMREAPKSFFYKMLRKKNITLNGKKAEGGEILEPGDVLRLFLSEDTYEKFGGIIPEAFSVPECGPRLWPAPVPILEPGTHPPAILYEDAHILLFDKPAGILSQKAAPGDISLTEYLCAYLLESGQMTEAQMRAIRPSVCNRLDRNTSGLVAAGKSLAGLQTLSRLLRERTLKKTYRCIVCGTMKGKQTFSAYLSKDSRTNQVTVTRHEAPGAKRIETACRSLACAHGLTLLEVLLITGKSHQIRAHLSSLGHPILGDRKYGNETMNQAYFRSHGVKNQLLHAWAMEFPVFDGPLSYLSGRTFTCPVPEIFDELICEHPVSCETGGKHAGRKERRKD